MAEPQGEDAARRPDHKYGAIPPPASDSGNGSSSYRPASYSATGQARVAPRGYDRERRVDSLIDGVLGGSTAAPAAPAARPATQPAPAHRPPLTWPPRPAASPAAAPRTQTAPAVAPPSASPAAPLTVPQIPAGEGMRAYAPQPRPRTSLAARLVRPGNWTYRGLRSRTRIVLGLIVAGAMVAAAVITANVLAAASATNFAGAVAPQNIVGLNFPATGVLTSIDVQQGQMVQAGQLLATEANNVYAQDVNTDLIQQASDNQALGLLLGSSGQAEAAQAQQILAKANQQTVQQEQQAAARIAAATNVLNQAEAALQVAQNQQTTDQAAYTTYCAASNASSRCATLQRDLARDGTAIQAAQARVAADQTNLNNAGGLQSQLSSLTTSELQLAKKESANGTPSLVGLIRDAGDALAADEAKLVADESALASTELFAPVSGQVVYVGASAEELVGGTGTRSNPNGVSGNGTTAGTNSAPAASTTAGTPSGIAPLIEINVGTEALAQIPEADISSIHIGEAATVTVNALSGQSFAGAVQSIGEQPVDSAGAVYYDVYVVPATGATWPAAVKDGMTVNVQIG